MPDYIPTLVAVDPWKIEPNPDNPRRIFDEEDLLHLKDSIQQKGILVPLIVYRKSNSESNYILLDGERRLRCAQNLDLSQVPVNIISRPDKTENILLMFNIHNVRKDWELIPTALKLEVLIRLLHEKYGKIPTATELSKLTGLKANRINDCKRVLKYKKYHELALDPRTSNKITGDFFSQLDLALDKISEFEEISARYSNDQIIEIMIRKRLDDTIKSFMEFRLLRKIFSSEKEGVNKRLIVQKFYEFLRSKPVRDNVGRILQPAKTIEDLYDSTAKAVYTELEIIKTGEKLIDIFRGINPANVHDDRTKMLLNDLAVEIKAILKSV